MIIQKTFKNSLPNVYLVGTPIGNLDDISLRAIEILKSVNYILCEDTRTSQKLLNKYNINNKLISFHKYNEKNRIELIINKLSDNKNIAIISDAGVPIISDPAAYLIYELRNQNINCNISSVNAGPAYIHALILSGLAQKENFFYGFIKNKNDISKKNELIDIKDNIMNRYVTSFYESVHRIIQTINTLYSILEKTTKIVIARELTKINEEIIYGTINEIYNFVNSEEFILKGEFVIIVDKNIKIETNIDETLNLIKTKIEEGFSLKESCELVSKEKNISKKILYNNYISNKKR